jgi:hypothetical protein
MNIFIIESPRQLLSAIEADYCFKDKKLFIVKYNSNKENCRQIKNIIEYFSLKGVVEISSSILNAIANIRLLILMKKIDMRQVKRVFIGDYRSFHMRLFFNYFFFSESFCLEDGSIDIHILNSILLKKDLYGFIGLKGVVKSAFYKLQLKALRLDKLDVDRNIGMFSSTLSTNEKIEVIQHNYEYLRLVAQDGATCAGDPLDIVYIYGTPMHLIGFSLKVELIYIKNMVEYYSDLNCDIVYIAHRRDSRKKLKALSGWSSVSVVINEFPAEMQMIINPCKPSHIASIFSSALFSMLKVYNFKSSTLFTFEVELLNKKFQEEYRAIINFYKGKVKMVRLK